MVLRKIIENAKGEVLGYICETEARGTFFMQRKRAVAGRRQQHGVNFRYQREFDRMMRDNRMQGV